jgi:AcrR family transcriptional regulator
MTRTSSVPFPAAEHTPDGSSAVLRSPIRQTEHAVAIIAAARRLIAERGDRFTTQELVKEAGVALQTFYRHFGGKDQLLLAVFEVLIAEYAAQAEEAARELPDPVARLRFYVTSAVRSVGADADGIGPRFVTAQHWRLHQLFPEEISRATEPFTRLIARQLDAAAAAGLLGSTDPERDAWFVTKLVMAVFHHYAFVEAKLDADAIGASLWSFCRSALGDYTQ